MRRPHNLRDEKYQSRTDMKTARKPHIVVAAAALATFAPPALAYLDPGTGSMILSAIIGLVATAVLAVKTYWYKLKSLFKRGRGAGEEPSRRREAEEPAE